MTKVSKDWTGLLDREAYRISMYRPVVTLGAEGGQDIAEYLTIEGGRGFEL